MVGLTAFISNIDSIKFHCTMEIRTNLKNGSRALPEEELAEREERRGGIPADCGEDGSFSQSTGEERFRDSSLRMTNEQGFGSELFCADTATGDGPLETSACSCELSPWSVGLLMIHVGSSSFPVGVLVIHTGSSSSSFRGLLGAPYFSCVDLLALPPPMSFHVTPKTRFVKKNVRIPFAPYHQCRTISAHSTTQGWQ
nr:hypothetical protein Iba_chr02fCG9490 [Ipomoea batatas]